MKSAVRGEQSDAGRLGQVGARVARVAVDDETWAAFRQLCGDTPASVRLGQLVEADVRRARETTAESDAIAAVAAIRAHAEELEAFIRERSSRDWFRGVLGMQ